MEHIIYVVLLNEGSIAWRPVKATMLSSNVYKILENTTYDSEDETWEFSPGSYVLVKEKILNGNSVLLALAQTNDPTSKAAM